MIIARNIRGFLLRSVPILTIPSFRFCTSKPPNPPQPSQDPHHSTQTKIPQHYKPDPMLITKILKTLLLHPKPQYLQQQSFLYKNMSHLTNSDLILLLSYFSNRYYQMGDSKIFIAALKRIRQIKQITSKDLRRLIGLMMKLKWEQQPMNKLYSVHLIDLKQILTEDLCYLVLYGQYINKINLMTLNQYIKQILTREIKDRKSQFVLYQALFSLHAKKNFNVLFEFQQELRNFNNSIKNSEYQSVHGKWELVETISKLEPMRYILEEQLAKYELTLKEAVILGGVKDKGLISKVDEVFRNHLSQISPIGFVQLLEIVPSVEYFKQYLEENGKQLTDVEILEILERGERLGIEKGIIKGQFVRLFGGRHQIHKDLFERIQDLGQKIGIEKIIKHQENK